MKANSFIAWRGPSRLDGKPIMLIVTLNTANTGTGNMVQTHILRSDIAPVEAIKAGEDVSVCGACPLSGGGCYVNVGFAPLALYNAVQRGSIVQADDREMMRALKYRKLRCGSYGDPVAVPVHVWRKLLGWTEGHTGYTHQWRKPIALDYQDFLMASVETIRQARKANRAHWRTFRIKPADGEVIAGEILCPKSEENERPKTCSECMACDGSTRDKPGKVNVTITEHGGVVAMNSLRKMRALVGA